MSRMLTLANIADNPALENMISDYTLLSWVFVIALFLFWCLVLWLIIYTSVRSALSAHRRLQAEDNEFARGLARQRRA